MGTVATTGSIREIVPHPRARLTGLVYLLYFAIAILAEYLLGRKLMLYSDVANVVANGCYVVVNLLFYRMFLPVHKSVSTFAALLGFAGCVTQTLRLFHLGFANVSPFVFFGPYCIFVGYLILRSNFLPRVLGALMVLAGLGWLAFLVIPHASHELPYVEILGVAAEAALMLWLVFVGVDASRWAEAARRTEGYLSTKSGRDL